MKTPLIVAVCCALAFGSGYIADGARDEVRPKGRYSGLEAHETSAGASLLGQFRTSVSGWLWVRTDLYLHNGVAMRPLSERELEAGRVGVGSKDNTDGALHDDSKIVTVIPSAERDFRGVFGDIHRATAAYKDMTNHGHNEPYSALPLFRLMTWIDPHFINGWTVGAAVLAMRRDEEGYRRALEFLEEGLEKNPDSIAILNQMGFTYVARMHDLRKGMPVFERAIRTGETLGLARLSEDDRDGLQQAYRWLALVYRDRGMLERMYPLVNQGLALFPEDTILARIQQAPPLVLARQAPEVKLEEPEEPFHDH